MRTLKNANEKGITYELVYGKLTSKDKEKILKLVRKIEEGKGIARKFKNRVLWKSHYDTKKILAMKITYENETFTLLDHAKLYKNNQAVDDILQEAKKLELSEDILSVEPTIEQQTPPPTAVTETATNVETESCDKNSEKAMSLNTATKAVIVNIEALADVYENSNKSSLEESIEHKPCENSNESNTIAIEHIAASIEKLDNTGICENSTTNILTEIAAQPTLSTADSTDKANTLSSTEMKSCFDNRSGKENTVNEKEEPSTKVMQQRRAIMAGIVGAALLVGSVVFYVLEVHVTVAIAVGIVGLACIGFALYDALKPNTKFERVENTEQLDLSSPSL